MWKIYKCLRGWYTKKFYLYKVSQLKVILILCVCQNIFKGPDTQRLWLTHKYAQSVPADTHTQAHTLRQMHEHAHTSFS